jgi:hypothetical protein
VPTATCDCHPEKGLIRIGLPEVSLVKYQCASRFALSGSPTSKSALSTGSTATLLPEHTFGVIPGLPYIPLSIPGVVVDCHLNPATPLYSYRYWHKKEKSWHRRSTKINLISLMISESTHRAANSSYDQPPRSHQQPPNGWSELDTSPTAPSPYLHSTRINAILLHFQKRNHPSIHYWNYL